MCDKGGMSKLTSTAQAVLDSRSYMIERTIRDFRETVLCHHDERVRDLMTRTEIRINGRLTVTAGQAFHYRPVMEVSGPVFRCPVNTIEDLWDTLAHEFAHLCEFAFEDHSAAPLHLRGEDAAHNASWRAWALEFGDRDGGQYHDLYLPRRGGKCAERTPSVGRWIMRGRNQEDRERRLGMVNAWRRALGECEYQFNA